MHENYKRERARFESAHNTDMEEQQAKVEQQYLTDGKLRSYFQKSMKYVVSKLDADSYDFVLVHDNQAGVPKEAFGVFAKIFAEACYKLGIKATVESSYINVDKPSVRKLLKTVQTKTPRVDIDEKVRAMLDG